MGLHLLWKGPLIMPKAQRQVAPDAAAATLTKAVVRAAELLCVNQKALARILGVSPATVSRLVSGQYQLTRERAKEWEFGVLFVRIFRSLDAIFAHRDIELQWLNGENKGLMGKPLELMQTTEGMVRVLHYLDAHRGRI